MSKDDFLHKMKAGYDSIKVGIKYLWFLKLYDLIIYLSGNFPHKSSNILIRKVCRRFGLRNKKILDAGSFTGYHSFYFHCQRNKVVGVELSDKADYAKMRYGNYPIGFLKGDVNRVLDGLADGSFDFIFCSNLPLHYDSGSVLSSPYFDEFIDKAFRKLAPGGVLYYIFFASKHARVAVPVDLNELKEYCKTKGLKNYHIEKNNILIEDTAELVLRK